MIKTSNKQYFQAYEPSVKRRNSVDEAVSNTNTTPQEVVNTKNIETWSSSMTSLKAKIQLKSELKKSQKKRRDRVLDQLKDIEATQKQVNHLLHTIKIKLVRIVLMFKVNYKYKTL